MAYRGWSGNMRCDGLRACRRHGLGNREEPSSRGNRAAGHRLKYADGGFAGLDLDRVRRLRNDRTDAFFAVAAVMIVVLLFISFVSWLFSWPAAREGASSRDATSEQAVVVAK